MEEIIVIEDNKLSKPHDKRYVIVNKLTGEVIDNAQGYGYRTIKKAYAAYTYKHRDKSKDREKVKKENYIRQWMNEHKDFVECLEAYSFDIACGRGNPEEKFNATFVNQMLKDKNLKVDFTASELLKVFLKYY